MYKLCLVLSLCVNAFVVINQGYGQKGICCVFFFFCYWFSTERPVCGVLSPLTGWECVRDWPKPIIHLGLSATVFDSACIRQFTSVEGLLTEAADIWPMTGQRSKSLIFSLPCNQRFLKNSFISVHKLSRYFANS